MRRLVVLLLALLMGGAFLGPVAARDASPVPGMMTAEELGLPELAVRYTEVGYEAPAEIPTGRYLVTFENASTQEFAAAGFLMLPDGWTIDELNARFEALNAMFSEGPPEGEASPVAGMESATPAPTDDVASPAAEEDPLAWLYQATIAGGVAAEPGETRQAIVDLAPGNWALWGDDFAIPAAALTVTGDALAPQAEVNATVTITELDTADGFVFELTGTLATGRQIIKIENLSSQPHFMEISRSPLPLTMDQLMQLFTLEPGTPVPAGLPSFEEITVAAFAATQSAGTTQWLIADLQAGTHLVLCFIPDPVRGGTPHAFEGMAEIVEIGAASDGATPAA